MSVINTNYLALVSQNNLTKSQNSLGTAIERLSSGLRINSAKDDAAGQAIANRFTANVKGLTQATRNANDGISIAQTTEGALNEINNNLQRVRELTVQAANGTYEQSDLDSMQAEIDQRLQEITRVSEQTQFNGVKVLGSSAKTMSIQVGANDGQTISIGLREISAKSLNLEGFNVNGKGSVANKEATEADLKLASNIKVTDTAGTMSYELKTANTKVTSADIFAAAIETSNATFAVTANATILDAEGLASALGFASGEVALANGIQGKTATGDVQITATSVDDADVQALITGTASGPVTGTYEVTDGNKVEIQIDSAGNVKSADGKALFITANGELTGNQNDAGTVAATSEKLAELLATESATLTLSDGTKITGTGTADTTTVVKNISTTELATISADQKLTIATTLSTDATADGSAKAISIVNGKLEAAGALPVFENADGKLVSSAETLTSLTVHDNGKVTDGKANQYYVADDGSITREDKTVSERNPNPLADLDAALADVDNLRGELGAVQNRFQSTIANLSNTITNLSAARSRIEDADYAVEVSNMTRAQILQQAGTSVLAQANQVPQGVLSLLR